MPEIHSLPSFDLPCTSLGRVSGTALQGHYSMLYFYPRDNTSGCSLEASEFSTLYPKFRKLGALIFGISRDSLRSHERFTSKLAIPFPLIADEGEVLCRAFDVIREKSLYGRKYQGIDRSTFLFDPAGRLLESWRSVHPRGHAEAVLERLRTCVRWDANRA